MPEFIAAAAVNAFVAAGGYASSAAGAALYATTYIATTAALTYGVSAISADLNSQQNPGQLLDLQVASDYPRQLLVGEYPMAGSIVGEYVTGPGNNNLVQVIALADHRCDACLTYYANNVPQLSNLVHGVRTEVTSYRSGGPRLWVTWFDGRDDQTADAVLAGYTLANQPDWTSNHRGRGVSYAIVEMQWDEDNMMTRVQSLFLLRGARFYDRRKDTTAGGVGSHRHKQPSTWEYTTNPDVISDHYQLGIVPYADAPLYAWGIGLKPWQLPFDQFKEEADISDELVTKKDGVTEQPRYAVNTVFSAAASHKEIITKLAVAKAGRVVDRGGRLAIVGPQARTPVMTLYDTDLVSAEQSTYTDKLSISDLKNTFEGRFPDPQQLWRPVDFPRITDAGWIAEDGGDELTETVDFDVDTDEERVQRVVYLHAKDKRRQARLVEAFGPWALELEAGDWFERVGIRFPNGKLFEVTRQEVAVSEERGLYCIIAAKEVDPDDVAWDANQAAELSRPPAPTQEVINIQLAPPVLSVSAVNITGGGLVIPAVAVSIGNATDPRVREALVEIVPDGGGPIIQRFMAAGVNETNGVTVDEGLAPATDYIVRARFQGLGVPSEWSTDYPITTGGVYNVPTASAPLPGSALDDLLNDIEDQLDGISSGFDSPYDTFPGFSFIGGLGDIDIEANVDAPSDIKISAGYLDHPLIGNVDVALTQFQTAWGELYAPPIGFFGIAWSEEPVDERFANGAGEGHFFAFAYDVDGTLKAYSLDRNAGEEFTPHQNDMVVALCAKPLASGSDELSSADGVTQVDNFIRDTAVVRARLEVVEASAGDSAAAVSTLTVALADEVTARAAETSTLTANLATANANITTNATAIATETSTRASETSTLTANLATANASITANATAIATETSTRASQTSTLTANLATANTNITANATAIATETSARSSADSTLTANLGTANANITANATALATETATRASETSTLTANLAAANASISSNASAISTETSARAAADSTLTTNVGALSSTVSVQAGSITDLNSGAAWLEAVVAAGGGDLGAFRLRAGKAGSFMELVGTVLRFANVSNGAVIEVMRAVGGLAFFSGPISSDNAAAGTRMTISPGHGVGGSEVMFWVGPNTIAPSAQSRTNGAWSFGTDKIPYFGAGPLSLGTPFQATKSSDAYGGRLGAGYVESNNVTISASNGSPTYTYAWAWEFNPSGISITNPTSATTSFDKTISAAQVASGLARCTVTDSTGRVTLCDVVVELRDEN